MNESGESLVVKRMALAKLESKTQHECGKMRSKSRNDQRGQ